MRIKLTHLIIVSLISLSVVLPAVSNTSAAGEGKTIRSPRVQDYRGLTTRPGVRDHRKPTGIGVVRTHRPGRGSSGTPQRDSTTGAKVRDHRDQGKIIGVFDANGGGAAFGSVAKGAKKIHNTLRPPTSIPDEYGGQEVKDLVKSGAKTAKSVHKQVKGYIPEVLRPRQPHGTKRVTKAAKRAAKSASKKAKSVRKSVGKKVKRYLKW